MKLVLDSNRELTFLKTALFWGFWDASPAEIRTPSDRVTPMIRVSCVSRTRITWCACDAIVWCDHARRLSRIVRGRGGFGGPSRGSPRGHPRASPGLEPILWSKKFQKCKKCKKWKNREKWWVWGHAGSPEMWATGQNVELTPRSGKIFGVPGKIFEIGRKKFSCQQWSIQAAPDRGTDPGEAPVEQEFSGQNMWKERPDREIRPLNWPSLPKKFKNFKKFRKNRPKIVKNREKLNPFGSSPGGTPRRRPFFAKPGFEPGFFQVVGGSGQFKRPETGGLITTAPDPNHFWPKTGIFRSARKKNFGQNFPFLAKNWSGFGRPEIGDRDLSRLNWIFLKKTWPDSKFL